VQPAALPAVLQALLLLSAQLPDAISGARYTFVSEEGARWDVKSTAKTAPQAGRFVDPTFK